MCTLPKGYNLAHVYPNDANERLVGKAIHQILGTTRDRFHVTHRNLPLIVAVTMYHSLMVLAMDFVSDDGLSIESPPQVL